MANTPVLTDQTGQQILKALNETNAQLGGIGQGLKQLGEANMFVASAVAVKASADEDYKFYPATDGEKLLEAYELGTDMLLSIYDQFAKKTYRIPFSEAVLMGGVMWQFKFTSNDNNNPIGAPSTYAVGFVINGKGTSVTGGTL